MRKLIWGVALTIFFLGVVPALAQSPTAYVKGILDRVMAIQNNPSLNQQARSNEIQQIIRSNFDFDEMAKEVLGATYNQLNAAQRNDFIDTFRYLFQDSYTRMVLNFLKQENIEYGKTSEAGGKARVDTVIKRPNENIPVTYVMRTGGGMKLTDVIVDGVSILSTYKNQFTNTIRTKSFDYLLNRMKEQRRGTQ